MIQDMINSENSMNTTESLSRLSKSNMEHPHFPSAEHLKKTELKYARYTNHLRYSLGCSQQLNPK